MNIQQFKYIGVMTYGEVWRFNLCDDINKFNQTNIPISTYSNWIQRGLIPKHVQPKLFKVLKNKLQQVTAIYALNNYGVDVNCGEIIVNDIIYSSDIDTVIHNFITEHIHQIKSGTTIYFNHIAQEKQYEYQYNEIKTYKKNDKDEKVKSNKVRDEPICAIFNVVFISLSITERQGWNKYILKPDEDILLQLLDLKKNLKKAILIRLGKSIH